MTTHTFAPTQYLSVSTEEYESLRDAYSYFFRNGLPPQGTVKIGHKNYRGSLHIDDDANLIISVDDNPNSAWLTNYQISPEEKEQR